MWMFFVVAALAAEPSLSGQFRLAETSDVVTKKHQGAIERAMAALPWAFRPFARPRLEGAVVNCDQVELELAAARFQARCDDEDPFDLDRTTAAPPITGDNGKPYAVEFTVSEAAATLKFTGDDGGQRTIYAPQPDGSLLLTKELFSSHLPEPVKWTVRYERQP